MSRDEVIGNIGTIAKSGTREFFQSLTGDQAKDAHLIGQFGVGFYSSFIVADKVTLITRRAGMGPEHGVRWESDGQGEYTLEIVSREGRGTDVILHLREGEDELLSGFRLRSIMRKYSDHITLPILMKKEEWDKDKNEQVVKDEDEQVNQASALWTRPKSEISDEQYQEFYKHVAHDFEAPLAWTHARSKASRSTRCCCTSPRTRPFDLWDREHRHGVKLYVQRVFIMDDAEQLMPAYLRFVRGVIDSNDLPLNVSREILQESKVVEAIRAGSVKRVLGLLEDLAENDKDKYAKFWKEFGRVFKEGPGEDHANKERIAQAAALRLDPRRYRGADRLAGRLHRAHEGRPGQDLLHHGRLLRCGEEQPAPGDLPQERRRGTAAVRPGGRVGGDQPQRVRRQAAAVRG